MLRRSTAIAIISGAAVLAGTSVAAGFGTFKPAQTKTMAGLVYQVAVGDVNGDGRGDVVAANGESTDDHVQILIAKRGGGFRAPKRLVAGDDPDGVAIGRLNGDRRPDIAAGNYADDDVSVFMQRRNGSFRKTPDLPGGPGNWQIAIADLNRDGYGDIVTSNYDNVGPDDAISVHLGKAKGFRLVTSYPGGDEGRGLDLARVNGDKRPDVVAVTGDGVVSPYLTRANGTMRVGETAELGAANSYSPIALGDFTGEGRVDAVVADYGSDSLTFLRGNGEGRFAISLVPLPAVPGVWGVAAGNVNGRGGPDLAVNLYDDEQMQVLRGVGDGEFKPGRKYAMSDSPESITVGRVGKDRGTDVVVGTDTSADVFINKP
jgi:FG-GAP-like repeat/FG-GAP repeat